MSGVEKSRSVGRQILGVCGLSVALLFCFQWLGNSSGWLGHSPKLKTPPIKTRHDAVIGRTFTADEIAEKYCDLNDSIRSYDNVQANDSTSLMTYADYEALLASEYVKNNANPLPKSARKPTLRSYKWNGVDPNPDTMINSRSEVIDDDVLDDYLKKEKERRWKLGDDDITKIEEVRQEMATDQIPNIVHFIYFGCAKVAVKEYLGLMGALRFKRPRAILFHTNCEPLGPFWKAFKAVAGSTLKVVKRSSPQDIWGHKINFVEHTADVARMEILLEVGGVYLDMDSVMVRPMEQLMNHSMVLGEESGYTLQNAVIFAKRDSWFLRRWFWEYKYYKKSWGGSSTIAPWGLWKVYPDTIYVVKQGISRPNWMEKNLLYRELIDWQDLFILHFYGHVKYPDIKKFAVLNTTFGEVARHVIWGDYRARDVTYWIVTCNVTQTLVRAYEGISVESSPESKT